MNKQVDEGSNKWIILHMHLQDLLAAYADEELDEQEKAVVEAHLAGCQACRMDIARQQLLSQRLSELPQVRLSTKSQQNIDQILLDADGAAEGSPQAGNSFTLQNWQHVVRLPLLLAASGWAVALVLILAMLLPALIPENSSNIPMIEDVIAEYRHLEQSSLPDSSPDSVPALPARWPNAHLLASWKTRVGGAPAQAFAMRSGDSIVFQFRIQETVFFRNPKVRHAVAEAGSYLLKKNNMEILAMPLKNAGLLVVGPENRVPLPEQLTLEQT